MRNITYAQLRDEIIDQIDTTVTGQGATGDFLRQKKNSPIVIARAVSDAMIEFCRNISHVSVPDLVQTVELNRETITLDKLYGFGFPPGSMHERSDGGIISFILNGEQVSFDSSVLYEQVVAKSKLKMYNGKENIFNADVNKRRLYTTKIDAAYARIFKRPHSVYAPVQNMFHGVKVDGSTGSTVTITDGIGNSVSTQGSQSNIVSAVNNATVFGYTAERTGGSILLKIRHDVRTDAKMNPTIIGNSFTLTDVGTIDLPIPHHFIGTIASTGFAILLDGARRDASQMGRPIESESNEDS